MRPAASVLLIAALYALHQDVWFWREARPLVFGFLPIGLFYHAAFTAGCALVLWLLVTAAWPEHLEAMTPDLKVGPTNAKAAFTPGTPDHKVGTARR
jgi:hypothetical protein